MPGAVDLWRVVAHLRERLPENAILTSGAGNYTVWLHRLYRYAHYRSQLAPYSGAMGYGVPAAVAAKVVHPARIVVSWNGDGCFLMNGQELATAVQYGLAIVFIVVDNAMYGTIRMHQERHYPARVYGTDLVNPDFAALARAYGGPIALKSFDPAPIAHLRAAYDGVAPLGIVAEASYAGRYWRNLSQAQRQSCAAFLHHPETRPDFLSWSVEDLPHPTPFLLRRLTNLPVMTWTVRTAEQKRLAAQWADQIVFEGDLAA